MRLLVFGKTGQVARELADLCRAEGVQAEFLGREVADLANPVQCAARIASAEADIVINAAAYTAVDRAETEPELARTINAEAPAAMAAMAHLRAMPFLHISTDYVFDGSGDRPWAEDDPTAPQSVYGETKLAGERGVAESAGAHAILRTAWVFSPYGANFVKTMLRLGAERDALNIVEDQSGGPTPAAAIASALVTMARAFHAGGGVSGVFHFAGAPATTWADFAEAIFAARPDAPRINRIPTRLFPTPARRPANSVLDCRKIADTYGIAQPDWRQGLARVLKQLEAER
ncbi:MAG: dTDP-4-dehydrorhamnose reductase [Rhodobacteraceae bacterium]|nr:dTDP-4-dehydrorhamnose reductase [Paracoccaceae bacterium]